MYEAVSHAQQGAGYGHEAHHEPATNEELVLWYIIRVDHLARRSSISFTRTAATDGEVSRPDSR